MKSAKQQLAEKRRDETVAYLWSCYRKDRGNIELRNRLVEHYTPLVQQIARRYIRRLRLREADTAIGDALLLLMVRLVPEYDGKSDFRRWALLCIREKMHERRRQEHRHCTRFQQNIADESDWAELEAQLVRPAEPGSDVRFAELAASLPARDAAVLWLRFYRHLSHRQIGYVFKMTNRAVAKQIGLSIGALQELTEEKPGDAVLPFKT
jgi:RNA polymerase sigma factor (sigma-70 family)